MLLILLRIQRYSWEYLNNSAKVVTKYNVTTKNMETGAVGGDTIMALYPHQWRYTEADFTKYTYNTIRGTMKNCCRFKLCNSDAVQRDFVNTSNNN